VGDTTQNKFWTGLGEFEKLLKRIIKSPPAQPRVPLDGHPGEQEFCELPALLDRSAPVPT